MKGRDARQRQKAGKTGKFFPSSRPCARGHVGDRYVIGGSCVQCAREKYRKFQSDPAAFRAQYPQAYMLFNSAKHRAKKAGLAFDLTLEFVQGLIDSTPVCPVFGVPLEDGLGRGYQNPWSRSLDRFIPELGYIQSNVRMISLKANVIKRNFGADDLTTVARWIESVSV